MKRIVRKKYATGTSVKNYLTDPAELLAQNSINMAKAQSEVANNDILNAMTALGGAGMSYGIDNMKMSDFGDVFKKKAAFGGKAGKVPVEVEGKEVAETPGGEMMEFEGPSHEKGGIDVDLPAGTDIFSKRIKVANDTMAERKKKRESHASKIQKLFDTNPTDKALKKTLERTLKNNSLEEAKDMQIQEMIASLSSKDEPRQKAASGINNLQDKTTVGTEEEDAEGLGFTPGDVAGMLGTLYGAFAGKSNTLDARASDTPNINAYENFGEDALASLDKSKEFVQQTGDRSLQDIALSENAAIRRGRGSARGVNTMRDLDLTANLQGDDARTKVYSTISEQMMQLLGQESQLENAQDQVVMGGEQARDLADREDKDNFYTQLGIDKQSIATGVQQTGKQLNEQKANEMMLKLMQQLSAYGFGLDKEGNVTPPKEK